MMKKIALCAAALAHTAGSALAADLPSYKAPPVYIPPPPLWTGFYVGVNIGGGWNANNNASAFDPALLLFPGVPNPCKWGKHCKPIVNPATGAFVFVPSDESVNAGGVLGGGQIGYNYQFSSMFLVGGEADIQGTSISSNNGGGWWGGGAGLRLPWFGTVRGRAGLLAMPTLLLYGTGGFAYGGVHGDLLGGGSTRTGWTAGGGGEWMFIPNWSAKLEYLFVDLDSGGNTGAWGWNWGSRFHPQFHVVRAGVNYHFNWGAVPGLATY
jgi:outer membrane immunogenic protein